MSKEVNAELYEFLKINETGLFQRNNEVVAYVHIEFNDLEEFVNIVSESWFDEGGIEARMFSGTICVEINDIIESEGHYLSSYKKCFCKSDYERYEDLIVKLEQ